MRPPEYGRGPARGRLRAFPPENDSAMRPKPLIYAGLCLLLVACASAPGVPPSAAARHDNLDATVWMQTAAEQRAILIGGYAQARQQLEAALADPCWDALPESERGNDPCGLPPAIVTDADETLIDNTAFQARRIRDDTGFVYEGWRAWVNERRARALPGAVEFFRDAAERGVTVYYVTNRDHDGEFQATLDNLRALGFPVAADGTNLLLRGDPRAPAREKGERRRWVGARHRVLLVLGDNLGDFLDGVDRGLAERTALVDAHRERWGRQWIMFPNPAYGSWETALLLGCPEKDPTLCKRRALRLD